MISSLFNRKKTIIKNYRKKAKNINNIYEKLKQSEPKSLDLDSNMDIEEVFAYGKYAISQILGKELYENQLVAALAMHDGNAIEMKTGEGKTFAAVCAAIAYCIQGNDKQSYIVSANQYLIQRDFEMLKPVYKLLGLSVGAPEIERTKESFKSDIVFATHSFLAFRTLQDNLVKRKEDQLLNSFDNAFVIIDEADSVLIDDARSPFVISGDAVQSKSEYIKKTFLVAKELELGSVEKDNKGKIVSTQGDFYIEEKKIFLTEDGSIKAESLLDIESLYELDNVFLEHYILQCLNAIYLKEKDVDYVVENNKIILIDENTGRKVEGSVLSEGLHQAIEIKENTEITKERQPIASITLQNLFKTFDKMVGMSGTIGVEALEIKDVYGIDTVSIPSNKESKRVDKEDKVFLDYDNKFEVLIKDIEGVHKKGQPVLVGTISVEQCQKVSDMLTAKGLSHSFINAKNHLKEAQILSEAGEVGKITVVTNMAGRGVDIVPSEEALALGGLYIFGAERNLSRRYDNQLIGRAGRQGNPGTTQFYISIQDKIMKNNNGDAIEAMQKKLSLSNDIQIEFKLVSSLLEKAQQNFDLVSYEIRKDVIAYDDVHRMLRNEIISYRNRILNKDLSLLDNIGLYRKEFISNFICNYYSDSIPEAKKIIEDNIAKYCNAGIGDLLEKIDDTEFSNEKESFIEKILVDLFEKRIKNKLSEEKYHDFMLESFLNIIDENVKEFYMSLEMLKAGINLRSYTNKKPVDEYKKEAYHLYEQLMTSIKLDYAGFIHKVEVKA